MSQTDDFIRRLQELKAGDLARLRQLAGEPLDKTVPGFDLFTGLWWPLRQKNPTAPERRSAWLVAKLYGAFPLPHVRDPVRALACVLARTEPREQHGQERFRARFDALLTSPLSRLEPHLRWALSVVRKAVGQGSAGGIDWVQLLDDLRVWDRGNRGATGEDVREKWANQYLNPFKAKGREDGQTD